jgi:hypothetical protein
MDQSVPRPDPAHRLSEEQKRAMELQGEAEHATGEQKEQMTEQAERELPARKV